MLNDQYTLGFTQFREENSENRGAGFHYFNCVTSTLVKYITKSYLPSNFFILIISSQVEQVNRSSSIVFRRGSEIL